MTKVHRGCSYLVIGFLVIVLVVATTLFFIVRSRADLRALLSSGGEVEVKVPPDFEVNIFASDLAGPRFIAFGPDGRLYVAERGSGRIIILADDDKDGRADDHFVFAEDLDQPHSLVYHNGAWFVGLPGGVAKLEDGDGDGTAESRSMVVGDLPTSGSHRTRTVAFLPDGRMVVSIGSSCNVCLEEDPRRAAVVVYDGPEGGGESIFASGLRNAVGLALHPDTGQLWATNNGRDLMGDDLPPETVYILQEGVDYGWPVCHSGDVIDPDYGEEGSCDSVGQPVVQMQAHSAPLGLVFYTGDSFPEEYFGDLFIAFHGSWNRREPTGYKVVRLPLDGSEPAGPLEDFAAGWLDQESGGAQGRPVGLAVGPQGDLFISDDRGGFIYRVTYVGQEE